MKVHPTNHPNTPTPPGSNGRTSTSSHPIPLSALVHLACHWEGEVTHFLPKGQHDLMKDENGDTAEVRSRDKLRSEPAPFSVDTSHAW
jgi:hypothetical protein